MSARRDAEGELLSLQSEDVHVVKHDMTQDGLSTTITLALAEVTGRPPEEVLPDFARYVDPDALDRLFRVPSSGDHRVGGPLQVTVDDHDVFVYSDGHVVICER